MTDSVPDKESHIISSRRIDFRQSTPVHSDCPLYTIYCSAKGFLLTNEFPDGAMYSHMMRQESLEEYYSFLKK